MWNCRPWLQDTRGTDTLYGIAGHGYKMLLKPRKELQVTHMHHVTGVQLLETSTQLTHDSTGCDFRNPLAAPNVPSQVSSCTVLHDQVQVVGCLRVTIWLWQSVRFYSIVTCCS